MRKGIRRKKWFYTLTVVGSAIGLSAGSSYVCGKIVYAAGMGSKAASEVSSEVPSEEAKKYRKMAFDEECNLGIWRGNPRPFYDRVIDYIKLS